MANFLNYENFHFTAIYLKKRIKELKSAKYILINNS